MFATRSQRRELVDSQGLQFTVQVITADDEEQEAIAQDLDDAIYIRSLYLYNHGAKQANICRVFNDGSAVQSMS